MRLPIYASKRYSKHKQDKSRGCNRCLGISPIVYLSLDCPVSRRWLCSAEEKSAAGKEPKLNAQQLQQLYRIITTKNPVQLDFEFALWTRSMIRKLIKQRFAVRLSDISVGRLLRKLDISPPKPLYRAFQQDEEKVTAWKEKTYPEFKKLAKKAKATICHPMLQT